MPPGHSFWEWFNSPGGIKVPSSPSCFFFPFFVCEFVSTRVGISGGDFPCGERFERGCEEKEGGCVQSRPRG